MKTQLCVIGLAMLLACGCGSDVAKGGDSEGAGSGTDVSRVDTDAVAPTGVGYRGRLYDTLAEPTECLTDTNCIDNSDCPGGQRCNETLESPRCQKVSCATVGEYCDVKNGDELCRPGHFCVVKTGLSDLGEIEHRPWCASDDCRRSNECITIGACVTSAEGECVQASTNDCGVSLDCQSYGQCLFNGTSCVAGDTRDCLSSGLCDAQGDCALIGSECGPASDEHCAESSVTCATFGRCAIVDGTCAATSDATCADSENCASVGACALGADGTCVPGSQEHCAQSSECRNKGRNCDFVDATCVGEPTCEYVGGKLCTQSYNGCGISKCQCDNHGAIARSSTWFDYCEGEPCPSAAFLCSRYCSNFDGNSSWTGGCILSAVP